MGHKGTIYSVEQKEFREIFVQEKFFQLLRYTLDETHAFPQELSDEAWRSLFEIARQQSLLGLLFDGIQRWSKEGQGHTGPPKDVLLKWYTISERIKAGNKKANAVCVEVTDVFAQNGFRTCVLKGQGNTLNYPSPFIRTSGDIDLWIEGGAAQVLSFLRGKRSCGNVAYHHADAGTYKGVAVEAHYRPSFMANPVHNQRMQEWFKTVQDEQFSHQVHLADEEGWVCVPTHAFNRVYQLTHIFKHVIQDGIGLRQIIDYYFVLKQGFTEEERVRDERLLRHLGLYKVASAVMWVLKEALGMEERCLLVKPNKKLGSFLLDEIMLSGNFGQYDPRVKHGVSQWEKNLQRLKRDWRLVWYFPSECLWEPAFRWYHFFWRLRHEGHSGVSSCML